MIWMNLLRSFNYFFLQASSFLEIGRHSAVYRVILGIVREMSGQSCLVSLLGPLPDQSTSIHSLLQGMEAQASVKSIILYFVDPTKLFLLYHIRQTS